MSPLRVNFGAYKSSIGKEGGSVYVPVADAYVTWSGDDTGIAGVVRDGKVVATFPLDMIGQSAGFETVVVVPPIEKGGESTSVKRDIFVTRT